MKNTARMLLIAAFLGLYSQPLMSQTPTSQDQVLAEKYKRILHEINPRSGDISISEANSVLHLGKDYYFLNSSDAKRVLTDGWGNPADSVSDVLGMVFPSGKTFVDDTWGAVVTYHQSGYVTDDDAKSVDYDKIITDFRTNEDELNKERQKQGFSVQHLVGWAQPPAYDPQNHSVIWARNIRFGDQTDNTLNYDVRLLGRQGVLSLNMVAAMSDLSKIRPVATNLGQVSSFNSGSKYTDYNANTDKKAGYGIGGLVAAGVGVVAAKKLGLLAIIALAGKKVFVIIAALFAGLAGRIKRFFSRGKTD